MTTAPTVDEIRTQLAKRNASLGCSTCGEDQRFSIERVSLRGLGRLQMYGNYRLERTQVVCDACGQVESFDLARLRAAVPMPAVAPVPVAAETAETAPLQRAA